MDLKAYDDLREFFFISSDRNGSNSIVNESTSAILPERLMKLFITMHYFDLFSYLYLVFVDALWRCLQLLNLQVNGNSVKEKTTVFI